MFAKHPFLISLILGIITVTLAGLCFIMPAILMIQISLWFGLLYLPVLGACAGIKFYLDNYVQ